MGFGIYKQLVVLTLALCLVAANKNHLIENFQPQNSTIEGRVHWTYVYDRDSLIYYMDSNLTAVQGSPFSFDVSINSGEIQLVLTKYYLTVDINTSKLGMVEVPSRNTTFNIIPYTSEPNEFYLVHNATNQVIITPNNRPPFSFYIQSRYPDISEPAVFKFTLAEFFLEEMYDGQRNNTLKTLEAIHNITDGSMEDYYIQFLNLTESYGHWTGKEIFLTAFYITEDLGIGSTPFQLLPLQVRLIFSGPCRLLIEHQGTGTTYIMVNSTYASTDQLVYPYTFTFDKSNGSSTGWFQVQTNNRQNTSWNNNGIGNTLNHTLGSGDAFRFQFDLQSDLSRFEIHTEQNPTSNSGRFLCRWSPGLIYTLRTNDSTYYSAYFKVEQFHLNVTKLYSRIRGNILDTIHLIRAFSGDENNKSLNYQILLDGMVGHSFQGGEIFCIGLFIQQDFPGSDLYEQLPYQVKMLLTQDERYELYLNRSGLLYPFKYAYASDLHENIETYSIEFGPDFYNPVVSISYGNSGTYQWDLDEELNLIDVLSTERRLKFRITRDSDLNYDGFQLRTISSFYFLRVKSTTPDFYFYGSEQGFVSGYRFAIKRYAPVPTEHSQSTWIPTTEYY